jgi:hypothetical protein
MRAFVVSETFPAASRAEVTVVERAFGLACSRLRDAGAGVELLATSYLPLQRRWLGLVLADTLEVALRVAATAQLVTYDVTEV